MIINKCDGNSSLYNIIKSVGVAAKEVIEAMDKFLQKKLIEIKGFQLYNISCPDCKNSAYIFIPNFMMEKSKKGIF